MPALFSIQVEDLKLRLTEAEKQTIDGQGDVAKPKRNSLCANGINGSPPPLPKKPVRHTEKLNSENPGTQMRDSVPTTGVIVCF